MTRREMLIAGGAASAASVLSAQNPAAAGVANPHGKLGLGATPTGFGARLRANAAANPPVEPIDYYRSIGLGGFETGAPPLDASAAAKLRDKLQTYNMHIMFNVRLPNSDNDIPAFEAGVKAAKEIGAHGIHAALTGRRYEVYSDVDTYQKAFEQNRRQVALAEPVLRRNKIRLAIENHKGWSAEEQAAWLKKLSSEYVGVHFDTGNNVSFCEDPLFTMETLKPWIVSGHLKDMAVMPYQDGFLLSEVPFGDGFLDLKKIVTVLRQKDPEMYFDLETITRDPLKIPIYTDKYWATFPDMKGKQMAKMMEILQKNPPKKPLPKTSGLAPAKQLKLEDDNNMACIVYARQHLGI